MQRHNKPGNEIDETIRQRKTSGKDDSSPGDGRTDVESWLKKSREARDPLTALEYLQQASEANPHDSRVQSSLRQILLEKLKDDPYVAFLAETDKHYVVTFRHSRPVLVPKARARSEIFPPATQTESERVLGKVWWIVLGLILGGVGAFVASLLVLARAFRVLRRPNLDARERRLAWLAVILAAAIGLLGEFFTVLLIMHFIG